MNKFFQLSGILIVSGFMIHVCNSKDCHSKNTFQHEILEEKVMYDSLKAAEYVADQYGMKKSLPDILKYFRQGYK
jgi:hypothetical protein